MNVNKEIDNVYLEQKKFLEIHKTISIKYRIDALKKLKRNIKLLENEICEALRLDLNKSAQESYMSEIGIVYSEISYMLKNMRKFCRHKRVPTPLANFPAKSKVVPCAYGNVLIISPWNYPFMLSIQPMIDAISAGNTVIIKPSEYSNNTTEILQKLINLSFENGYVNVIKGDKDVCSYLLDKNFDYIFYTGSTRVGKIVMQKAAEHFTPVTLELGGKSPCIVDKSANIKLSAKRIVFGKFLNAGQTCVAPDYILCDEKIKSDLIENLILEIKKQYGGNALHNTNYPRIINLRQFEILKNQIKDAQIVYGGKLDEQLLKIEPTLLNATLDSVTMKEEIFGPILPILTYKDFNECIEIISKFTKPLALYLFSNNEKHKKIIENNVDFGGGCINDTIMHIATNNLPFGGLKESGIGCYHGKYGFDTFTHYKSVVRKGNWLDLPMRYQKITKIKMWIIKKFLR